MYSKCERTRMKMLKSQKRVKRTRSVVFANSVGSSNNLPTTYVISYENRRNTASAFRPKKWLPFVSTSTLSLTMLFSATTFAKHLKIFGELHSWHSAGTRMSFWKPLICSSKEFFSREVRSGCVEFKHFKQSEGCFRIAHSSGVFVMVSYVFCYFGFFGKLYENCLVRTRARHTKLKKQVSRESACSN